MRFSFVLVCASLMLPLVLTQYTHAQENNLKPFTTDGCSMWLDGTPMHPYSWRHCCVAHDKAYWIGGSEQQRADADTALQACVANVMGVGMGNYMYAFVVMGGSPMWLTPYRWGYGWGYLDETKLRGYKLLTEAEQAQVTALLPQAEQTIVEDALKHPPESTVSTGE